MIKILTADFVTTATKPGQYPVGSYAEIAFVGRSNVGKSSMINTLANRNKLVRVSNTPGRTKALNFFDLAIEIRGARRTVRLCDLPGYGYAKTSKTERDTWRTMIGDYLTKRSQLAIVVCIVDGEIGATPDDMTMIDFLQTTEARILVVATKLDRIGKAKRKPQLQAIRQKLSLPEGAVMGFSAVERLGLEELWDTLLDFAG